MIAASAVRKDPTTAYIQEMLNVIGKGLQRVPDSIQKAALTCDSVQISFSLDWLKDADPLTIKMIQDKVEELLQRTVKAVAAEADQPKQKSLMSTLMGLFA